MPASNYPGTWKKTRARILKRDAFTCAWCGDEATTVDHVVPIADARRRGWLEDELHHDSNLVASCTSCNYSRSDRPGPPTAARRSKAATREKKSKRSTTTPRFLGARPTSTPQRNGSLSPGSEGSQTSLWDLSGSGDRGGA